MSEWRPAWKGPVEDGITFSLLSRWVVCRERFRLQAIEGLKEDEGFVAPIEFGSLWHEAEEAHARGTSWEGQVDTYREHLRREYPAHWEAIDKWTTLVKLVFPIYVDHWKAHPFVKNRRPLLQEESFRIPYRLPSGRQITLRGKFDAVWTKGKGIWLQENKTKGEIDQEGILQTLPGNLQVMIYLVALREFVKGNGSLDTGSFGPSIGEIPRWPVRGVVYNVIRRPLSARNSVRKRKSETDMEFLHRFRDQVAEDPEAHFMRWEASIYNQDVKNFEIQVLHPLLEGLLDWWEWISADEGKDPFRIDDRGIPGGGVHWRSPWGVYSSLARGFRGDFFDYLSTGSRTGLVEVETLFPELETV